MCRKNGLVCFQIRNSAQCNSENRAVRRVNIKLATHRDGHEARTKAV